MRKKYNHERIVNLIAKETGLHPRVVKRILYRYFKSFRKMMILHYDLTVTGFFKLKLRKNYRKKIDKEGNGYDFRERRKIPRRKRRL